MYFNSQGKEEVTFDAIVIGSGISGGWAAKELSEKGLKTLVLERGRDVKHVKDYPTMHLDPWDMPNGGKPTAEDLRQQGVQARTGYGYHVGGRLESDAREKIQKAFPNRLITPGRVANLSQPHNGRGACQRRNRCMRGCPYGGYFSSQSSTLPAAMATGNMTLRPHSIVHEIMYDKETKRAKGVRIIDELTKETKEYYAKVVFCCASAIGSTSILLNSKSDIAEAGIGKKYKNDLFAPGPWRMGMMAFGEILPYHENRMYLNEDKRDKWGLPTVTFDCENKENEKVMRKDMAIAGAEMLEAAGFKNITTSDDGSYPGLGIHEMGTARMGRDPKTSILNGNNQVHSVPNVFVTDGACMTSAACQNPSITYMALTARACDFAVKQLNRNEL